MENVIKDKKLKEVGVIVNKKSILKKGLVIILFYVLITILNNFRNIGSLMLGKSQVNIHFINLSIILSLLILSLIVIFKKFLFRNKISIWIIFCTLLVYNLAEGYFTGFVSYPFLILYIYIIMVTYVVMLVSSKRFEISMITGFSLLLIVTFVIGMLGLLTIVKYVMLLSVVLMIIYIYNYFKRDKIKATKTLHELFDQGFIIFNILWIIAILGGAGMYVNSWDEYSHWAYDAKATIYYSKYGASQEIMSKTKGYAPIFTVWHYIISIFNGFSEHNLYIGLSMLVSVYLMSAFYWIKKHNIITKILAFIAIVFCCYIFGGVYIYSSLYADLAISVIFSSILILYNISKNSKENLTFQLILLLIVITLSKTNGFVIAFVFMMIVFIDYLINCKKEKVNNKKIINYILNFIKKYYKYIVAIILTFLVWKIYLIVMKNITTEYYDFNLLPDSLKGDLKSKLDITFIKNFVKKVIMSFDSNLISGKISLSLYQFLLICFSGLFIIFYFKNGKKYNVALKMTIPYIIGYITFFILTVLAMFLMMTKYEASNLASFGRYLNWYHLGIIIFMLSFVLSFDDNRKIILNIIYIFIIILIPFSNIIYFIYNPLNSGSYGVHLKYTSEAKIVNEYTPKNSMVYIIDQKDTEGIMAMWHMRYYAFPRQTNASSAAINWKIRTEKNIDDLSNWGLTAEEWAEQLKKYKFDYVYLYSSDKYFFKETEFLYDDKNKASKCSLFKIVYKNQKLRLLPIK